MLLSDKYPFLTDYFTRVLQSRERSFSQSILFYGNDLKAQYSFAMEIARLLNCNTKTDDCECLNCRWIRKNAHPAVVTVSKVDCKPEDDESKTVISIKQSALIKEKLVSASEFYRVFIFCDKDEQGNICGLNQYNFQAEAANSLLKIIEEPQPGVTFIFLTRYIDDLLPTIISRSQCFFVPSREAVNYDYGIILGVFDNYRGFDHKDVFDISQRLADIAKESSVLNILEGIQNYIFMTLKSNPEKTELISHIRTVEECKKQAKLGIKPITIFDELCLKLIK